MIKYRLSIVGEKDKEGDHLCIKISGKILQRRPFDHVFKDKQQFSRWVRYVGEGTVAEGTARTKALSRESADCLVNHQQLWMGGKQEGCRSGNRVKQSPLWTTCSL